MLKYLFGAVALLLAGVPAYLGLTSNASFSRDVPVRVPEQAQVATVPPSPAPTAGPRLGDDDGTPDQGRGDRPRTQRTGSGDDIGDDNGGDRPRSERTEAGDDHGGDRPRDDRTEAGDDRDGSRSGSSDDSDDDSGHGSDDSGHGSDDDSGHH